MRADQRLAQDPPESPVWHIDSTTQSRWSQLTPGTEVTIVKRSAKHHGEDRVRYPGTVVETALPAPWVVLETRWTLGTIDQAHLRFEVGDILQEIFSPVHPFNAFAVYTPAGELKGWYGNITYPTLIEATDDGLDVVWHDLFVDVVATPDGEVAILDEDELEEADLLTRDPELHQRIRQALDHLLQRFHDRRAPFHQQTIAKTQSNV